MGYGEINDEVKRISVALDTETFGALKEMANRRKQTISQVVRNAITMQFESEVKEIPEEVEVYIDFLSGGEHVIVSVELWALTLVALEKYASNEFWDDVELEGYRRGLYYKNIGLDNLRDMLDHLKHKNWFRLKVNKNCYTLTLTTSTARKFVSVFINGILKALEVSVEIKEFERNLLIIEKGPAPG